MNVLVIDDDELNRRLLQRRLEKEDYVIQFAEDGKSALAVLKVSVPDVILLDLTLPDVSGEELLHTMKSYEAVKDTPVILLSGKDAKTVSRIAETAGAEGWITKPFQFDELICLIKNLLTEKDLQKNE
ncbi:MAG: response regulator transcription factor [Spirochaetia bacterium]